LKAAANASFASDFKDAAASKPSPHEKASALMVLTYFRDALISLHIEPVLVARMILGCTHLGTLTDQQRLENCLISLLNGVAIDVDKLDYILRDTWASGINNVSIDIHRLLSSFTYHPPQGKLAFKKNALSVLQSVVDARNYLYRWVFGHHKVVYNQYLLRTSVNALAEILGPSKDQFLSKVFSVDALQKPIAIGGQTFYLPTDNDILFLLKSKHKEIPEAQELLFRSHARKPLWKSATEFGRIFHLRSPRDRILVESRAKEAVSDMLAGTDKKLGVVVEPIPQKFVTISLSDIHVIIDNAAHSYTDLFPSSRPVTEENAFYVYVPVHASSRRGEFVEQLLKITS